MVNDESSWRIGPAGKQAAATFYERAMKLLQDLQRTEAGVIQQAAELCPDPIARGGLIFLFGNGHSRMMCEEMTPRQAAIQGSWRWLSWRSPIIPPSSERMGCERRFTWRIMKATPSKFSAASTSAPMMHS